MTRLWKSLGAACSATLLAIAVPSTGHTEAFPTKPVQLMIGGASGDAFDAVGRRIAPVLAKKLGVAVQVSNVTGPKLVNLFEGVHSAPADGHVIGLAPSTSMMQHALRPGALRFDIAELPIVMAIDTLPDVVFASPKSRFKTAQDLIKPATATRVRIGDYAGLVPGLASFAIAAKQVKGLQVQPVTFSVYPEAHVALLRGDIDIITGTGSGTTLRFVKQGDYVPLFVWGAARYAALPNVPSSSELGLPAALNATRLYRPFFTAPKTPADRIARLAKALTETLADPEIVEWAQKANQPLGAMSAAEYAAANGALLKVYRDNAAALQGIVK